MNATRWLIGGLAVAAATAVLPVAATADPGIGIGIVVAAQDSYGRDSYRRDSYGSVREAFRYGFDRGRQEGTERGYRDGSHGRDFDFGHAYRDAGRGYRGWMGSRNEFASGYRQGYESAYRRAFASARPGWHDRDGRYGDGHDRDGRYGRDDRYRDDPEWRR